ncbi:MAG: hypothetical protein AAF617_14775 [Bacteroidota bacterium]
MNFNTFSEIITSVAPFVLGIGASVGLYHYKRLTSVAKLLFYFLVGSLVIDLCSRLLEELFSNNLILVFALTLLELFIFLKLYYNITKKKKLVIFTAILGMVYTIFELIYVNTNDERLFQPYAKALGPLLIVGMALLFFFELIRDEENLFQRESDYFVLNSTILCFFSLQFLVFLPLNFLVNTDIQLTAYVWIGNISFMILFYLYLTYFIWKRGRNLKP